MARGGALRLLWLAGLKMLAHACQTSVTALTL
jgi:hypothetical protein